MPALRLIMTDPFARPSGFARLALSLGVLAGLLFSAGTSASPLLRCELSRGGEVQVLDFTPVTDPYSAKAVDLRGGFRFKAVVVGDAQQIEYIKLYAYYLVRRQAVLLHQAKYLNPVAGATPDSAGLTGINFIYSPDLGREFQYGCALLEAAP